MSAITNRPLEYIAGPLHGQQSPNGRAIYRRAEDGKGADPSYGDRWFHKRYEFDNPKVHARLRTFYVLHRDQWNHAYVWAPYLLAYKWFTWWLKDQEARQDEVGEVARFLLGEIRAERLPRDLYRDSSDDLIRRLEARGVDPKVVEAVIWALIEWND